MALGIAATPFFDDKNRAFWNLQTAGWAGYFLLRTLSGFANGLTLAFLVPVAVSTATGYSITLVLGALYRDLMTGRLGDRGSPAPDGSLAPGRA